jgi:hypothetical protein
MRAVLLTIVLSLVSGVVLGVSISWYQTRNHGQSLGQEFAAPKLAPVGEPQPRAVIDQIDHNFGAMERGAQGSHTFEVRNEGEADLVLKQGGKTCSCTFSGLSDGRIAPGGSGQVTLSWTVKGAGETFRQQAMILTNDRLRRRIILTLEGKITRPVVITPEILSLGDVAVGQSKSAEVHLYSFRDAPLELTVELVRTESAELFEVTQHPLLREKFTKTTEKSGRIIRVTVKSGLPLGQFRQTIRVDPGLAGVEPLTIPVLGRIVGDFTVSGKGWNDRRSALELGIVSGDQPTKRRLNILVRGPHRDEVQLEVAEVYPPLLDVRVGKPLGARGGSARLIPLTITIPAGQTSADFRGKRDTRSGEVILTTNHPLTKRLSFRIEFVIEGSDQP